jgi:hypothetical protein
MTLTASVTTTTTSAEVVAVIDYDELFSLL